MPLTFFLFALIFSIRTDNTKLDVKKRNKAYNITILTFIIFLYTFTLSILTDNQYFTKEKRQPFGCLLFLVF